MPRAPLMRPLGVSRFCNNMTLAPGMLDKGKGMIVLNFIRRKAAKWRRIWESVTSEGIYLLCLVHLLHAARSAWPSHCINSMNGIFADINQLRKGIFSIVKFSLKEKYFVAESDFSLCLSSWSIYMV